MGAHVSAARGEKKKGRGERGRHSAHQRTSVAGPAEMKNSPRRRLAPGTREPATVELRADPGLSSVYGGSSCADACSWCSLCWLLYSGWPLPCNPGCSTGSPELKWKRLHSTLPDTAAMTCMEGRQRIVRRSFLCTWPGYSTIFGTGLLAQFVKVTITCAVSALRCGLLPLFAIDAGLDPRIGAGAGSMSVL